jgi:Leucine-rich repeat (LRR) protein
MPHREDKVKEEMLKAVETGMLYLSHAALPSFPVAILNPSLERLFRLDLSFNNIQVIPKDIVTLCNLKELWLHNNPISEIPSCIGGCPKLEVIDIRHTLVKSLPPNIALLKKLVELDWKNTPLEETMMLEYKVAAGDVSGLKAVYHDIYGRDAQKEQLKEFFAGVHFLQESDKPNITSLISNLVEDLSELFPNLDDFMLFVRRANTLIPNQIAQINPDRLLQAREEFLIMKDATKRKRLSADVEIKLRNIYFDRVERSAVEEINNSIYEHVLSLEDIQFFVQYASKVLPTNPDNAKGELIWNNIVELQSELISKREVSRATGLLVAC